MLLVLLLAGLLWGLGAAMKVPRRARWIMLGLLYVAVLAVHVALPEGHPLRLSLGRDPALWLFLGAVAALVLAYRRGLDALRRRTRPAPAPSTTQERMSEVELDRYARHIMLREIGGPGQARLRRARVLVIGAGGLGAPALMYLAAAGVGRIGVIDDDTVSNSNLQRQIIHRDQDIGLPKVFSAQAALRALNPFVTVAPYNRRLTPEIARELIADYDLVLDGCDDAATRYLVNDTCAALGVALVSGALSQWEGQLSVLDPARGTPCYRCLFPEPAAAGLAPSCAAAGVFGPLPGIIGAMMAAEAVKLITDAGQPLRGRLLIHDALYGENRQITIKPRPGCATCGAIQQRGSA